MTRFRTNTFLLSLTLLGGTMTARAEPWIDTSNLALRTEIQYLADHGLIKAPVNTWPLMWAAIEGDLRAIDASQLDTTGLNAWQELGAVIANAIEYLDELFPVPRLVGGKLCG